MPSLYNQDPKTINMYEQEAVDFLMSSKQITHEDISTTIENSNKYSLVKMTANNLFNVAKMRTWSDVQNTRSGRDDLLY